jgi:hypothetical protein
LGASLPSEPRLGWREPAPLRYTAGATTSFTYGPDGTRLKKSSPSGATLYLGPDIERAPSAVWTKYLLPDAMRVGTPPAGVTT